MIPRFKLAAVASLGLDWRTHRCAVPRCESRRTERHHKGCERMWLRHFAHLKNTREYKNFKLRYEKFRKVDCVELCSEHHAEIHEFYLSEILEWAQEHGACRTWSWRRAELLMTTLRKLCDDWLWSKTLPPHK